MTDQPVEVPRAPGFREAGRAAFLGRATIIVSGLASALLLPLVLEQDDVGLFFIATLLVAGLATACQLGLTVVAPGVVTDAVAAGDLGDARRLAVTMVLLSTATGSVVVLLVGVSSPWLVSLASAPLRPGLEGILPLVAALAMCTGLTALVVELLRAIHAVRLAAAIAGLASIFAACYAAAVLWFGGRASVSGVLTVSLAGCAACVLVGLALLSWRTAGWPSASFRPLNTAAVLQRAVPAMLTTLLLFLLASVDLLILTGLGDLTEVAHYGLAIRFATLMLVPLGIANGAAAPLVVHAWSANDPAELRSVLDSVVRTGVGAAALMYVGFALTGYWFILWWNADYVDVYWLALVLGLGSALHACGGTAGALLMVWDDRAGALLISLMSGTVTVVLLVLGYQFAGVFGLAVGAALGNALQAAAFVLRVRARFGLDPSLLRLRRRPVSP